MQQMCMLVKGAVALALTIALGSTPLAATTLIRASVEDLVAGNQTIVVGEVVDAVSYWNAEGTFILTDVVVRADQVLKGKAEDEMVITQMGGTVGDLTTLILGGPELVPGRSYVLFLNEEDLPGTRSVTTVRDHCQGVFDIELDETGELRAISQANRHPLVPDRQGHLNAPGGFEGFPLAAFAGSILETAERLESEKGVDR